MTKSLTEKQRKLLRIMMLIESLVYKVKISFISCKKCTSTQISHYGNLCTVQMTIRNPVLQTFLYIDLCLYVLVACIPAREALFWFHDAA